MPEWLSQSSSRISPRRARSPGTERALGDGGPEVAGVRVGNHLALIVGGCEHASDDVLEPELLRAADLHDPVHGRADGNSGTPAATSSAAIGWNRIGGTRTIGPSVASSAMER